MAKRKPAKTSDYEVPMRWEFRGVAYVTATTPEEAVAKAKNLEDTELSQDCAELINWETTGDAKEQP